MKVTKRISIAANKLMDGELLVVPTETVYGLAANFNNEKAICKIFDLKKRPKTNPLIVHISKLEQLNLICKNVPKKALKLTQKFWPGPLTLVLEKNDGILPIITSNQNTVAVRMPNHAKLIKLLNKTNTPIVAPSANPFMGVSPTEVSHVLEAYPLNCPLILDGGNCKFGMESTIVGFENNEVVLYRYGAISIEEIEDVIGTVKIKNQHSENQVTPGMLKKHYSPKTPIVISKDLEKEISLLEKTSFGILSFKGIKCKHNAKKHIVLSKEGSYPLAMSNFYKALHELDKLQLEIIIAEQFPDENLGKVLNDRLERASFIN